MPKNTRQYSKGTKWTIMVYCAGDNELAPLIVSQLKGLKDAGRHKDVNVLVYFDPNEAGVPTRLYCLNQFVTHGKRSALDSYVQNMKDDDVRLQGLTSPVAMELYERLEHPDEIDAVSGLSLFLRFSKENYPAKHYALVLMGHGMIVANDAFLPDESPVSGITLNQLGGTLDEVGANLELLALHSCSMSAIEVAYELRGKAHYMIASEGLSFVGGWPYRQLLLRTFSFLGYPHDGDEKKAPPTTKLYPRELVEKLYKLASHNGLDFMLSGYSQDLALINLEPAKFEPLTKAMKTLVSELNKGLNMKDVMAKQLIQLAHLESQSYFDENYTDLYDFCFCLSETCNTKLPRLRDACDEVMKVLEPSDSKDMDERFKKIVIHSRHFGSHYQYSHGLSIYFPWSKPLGDTAKSVLKKYEDYAFNEEFKSESWLSFLNLYLEKTRRDPRPDVSTEPASQKEFGLGALSKPSAAFHKTSGASGASCSCPSIKNFPTEEREIKGKRKRLPKFAMSKDLERQEEEEEEVT
jgi:Clostripain family